MNLKNYNTYMSREPKINSLRFEARNYSQTRLPPLGNYSSSTSNIHKQTLSLNTRSYEKKKDNFQKIFDPINTFKNNSIYNNLTSPNNKLMKNIKESPYSIIFLKIKLIIFYNEKIINIILFWATLYRTLIYNSFKQ